MEERKLSLVVWENETDDRTTDGGIEDPRLVIDTEEDGRYFVYSYRLRRLLFNRWVKVARPYGFEKYRVKRLFDDFVFDKKKFVIGDKLPDTFRIDAKMLVPNVQCIIDAMSQISNPDGTISIPVKEFHIVTDEEIAALEKYVKPIIETKDDEVD